MPTLTVMYMARRGWVGVALVLGTALCIIAAIIGVTMLPGILFGTRLTPAEAEASIRGHLLSQAALQFHKRIASATSEGHETLHAQYSTEVEQIKAVEFISVDVDTVIFSAFKINRSFVVAVVMRGKEQKPSTHYFCFVGKYMTGECAKWHWFFAW